MRRLLRIALWPLAALLRWLLMPPREKPGEARDYDFVATGPPQKGLRRYDLGGGWILRDGLIGVVHPDGESETVRAFELVSPGGQKWYGSERVSTQLRVHVSEAN